MPTPGENLQNTDVQTIINDIVEKSNSDIKKIVGAEPVEAIKWGVYIIPPLFVIAFMFIYFLLQLYDNSRIVLSIFKWTIALGVYVAFAIYMNMYHVYKSKKTAVNIVNVTLSTLIPVFVTLLTLAFFPNVTTPIDNTLGFMYATTFSNARRVIKYFKYDNVESGSLLDRLKIPIDEISFGWLIKSLNPNNISEFIEGSKNESETNKDELIKYFYLETGLDSGGDIYNNEDVRNDLKELIQWKQHIGHMVYIFIASVFGVTTSMLVST